MNNIEKEKLIKADIESIENRVRHAFNQGYDLGFKDGQKRAKEPTTKNDLGVDCVARQDVERFIEGFINEYTPEEELEFINLELDGLKHLPPVTPKGPTDKIFTKAELDSIVKAINSGWELRINEVLDKIRAEIETKYGTCKLTEYIVQYDGICTGRNEIGDIAVNDTIKMFI